MAVLLKTLVNRSLHFDLDKTISYNSSPYQMICCHSFHQSRVLAHHKARDSNQPYKPPWKLAPLFPPDTYKKAFEKIRGGTMIIDYTTRIWSIYENVMKLIGPTVATMAAMVFLKNKELKQKRKKGNEELKNTVLETKKTLDGAVEELRVAVKMDAKKKVEFKEKVVKELLKMEGVKTVDKIKVGEKIVENELMAIMFLAATI